MVEGVALQAKGMNERLGDRALGEAAWGDVDLKDGRHAGGSQKTDFRSQNATRRLRILTPAF
jgi:hypothetical protein